MGYAIPVQDGVNQAVYFSPRVYSRYQSRHLTPREATCLQKYQQFIADKDVLDVGVGTGRTTGYLAPLARNYEAVDYSPVMVAYAKKAMPDVSIRQADFRDLSTFRNETFDFVFATDNVIDALAHEDRLRALGEAYRVLRPGNILALSAHNLNYTKAFSGPEFDYHSNPRIFAANFVQYLRRLKNYRTVGRLRTTNSDYALLNDTGHDFACLHYYTARSIMKLQLESVGLRLVEVFDNDGRSIEEGEDDRDSPSLLYVAERL